MEKERANTERKVVESPEKKQQDYIQPWRDISQSQGGGQQSGGTGGKTEKK